MNIIEFRDILNNRNMIEQSSEFVCINCGRRMKKEELDMLDDIKDDFDLNVGCPFCQTANEIIGNSLGISFEEDSINKLKQNLEEERTKIYNESHKNEQYL